MIEVNSASKSVIPPHHVTEDDGTAPFPALVPC